MDALVPLTVDTLRRQAYGCSCRVGCPPAPGWGGGGGCAGRGRRGSERFLGGPAPLPARAGHNTCLHQKRRVRVCSDSKPLSAVTPPPRVTDCPVDLRAGGLRRWLPHHETASPLRSRSGVLGLNTAIEQHRLSRQNGRAVPRGAHTFDRGPNQTTIPAGRTDRNWARFWAHAAGCFTVSVGNHGLHQRQT